MKGQEGRRPQEEDAVRGSISRTDPCKCHVGIWASIPSRNAPKGLQVCLQNHPSERSKSALAPLRGSQTIAHIDFGSSSSCEVITDQLSFSNCQPWRLGFGDRRSAISRVYRSPRVNNVQVGVNFRPIVKRNSEILSCGREEKRCGPSEGNASCWDGPFPHWLWWYQLSLSVTVAPCGFRSQPWQQL